MDRHFRLAEESVRDQSRNGSISSSKLLKTENPIYILRKINIFYSKKKILQNLDVVINPGDFIFITGATGVGKTTLLNFFNGDISSYDGEFQTSIKGMLNHNRPPLFISRVFQDLKIFEELTVLQNLEFCYDSSIHQNKEKFYLELDQYASYLEIKNFLNYPISKISGGIKQKMAIIRAVISHPDILLADEPTSNLDRNSATKFFEICNYLNTKKKTTIVWATHNIELIKNFHGKLIHLESGKITYSGNVCFT